MRRHHTPPVQGRKPPCYVGIDIGKPVHHADGLEADGTPCVPKVLALPHTRAGDEQLYAQLAEATDRESPAEVSVGCEATGPDWLSLYEALIAQGYHVLVLNPLDVKARRGTTLRGTKTDPVDARLMAEILRREPVPVAHIPEASVQGWRELTRLRAALVTQIGDVKRRISSSLERTFPALATCFHDVCGLTARTLVDTWTLPDPRAAVPTARLAAVLARLSHGHLGAEKARAVKAAAQPSIGGRRAADALAFERQLRLRQSRDLERLVIDLDQEIGRRYSRVDRYLRTIPGGGRRPPRPSTPRSGPSGASPIPISWWRWWAATPSSMSPGRRPARRR